VVTALVIAVVIGYHASRLTSKITAALRAHDERPLSR
jgi:hypothetical protein